MRGTAIPSEHPGVNPPADRPVPADEAETPATEAFSSNDPEADLAAFAAVVERHQGNVYGYLRARVLQASDAEDLTQEVFLRCYTLRARFDTSGMLGAWLMGIARNVLHEHIRRQRRRREVVWTTLCLELDELVHTEEQTGADMMTHLPRCLDALGPSARQAIDLRYSCKLRLAEIGDKLRRSEGAAKLLMFRARQALKSCLERKSRATAD